MSGDIESISQSEYIQHHLQNLTFGKTPEGTWGFAHTPAEATAMGFWAVNVDTMFWSVLLGVVVGVPLGIAAHRYARLGMVLLAAVGLMQTVPSLALLAFLIALTGTIGFAPALVALFLGGWPRG